MAFGLALVIFLSACTKTPVKPTPVYPKMTYRNLSDSTVMFAVALLSTSTETVKRIFILVRFW
jgi:hypothetical protein